MYIPILIYVCAFVGAIIDNIILDINELLVCEEWS
jgi:hypothetical protein